MMGDMWGEERSAPLPSVNQSAPFGTDYTAPTQAEVSTQNMKKEKHRKNSHADADATFEHCTRCILRHRCILLSPHLTWDETTTLRLTAARSAIKSLINSLAHFIHQPLHFTSRRTRGTSRGCSRSRRRGRTPTTTTTTSSSGAASWTASRGRWGPCPRTPR
jgi:hypothetical protein